MGRRKLAAKVDKHSGENEFLSSFDHEQGYWLHRHVVVKALWSIFGCFVMIYCGYRYTLYCGALNEAHLWFSNIKEVEREISFRTESGLYYSYYKQMVLSPTFASGLRSLAYDNITEYPSTINTLARMNVYQEVFLAFIYRNLPIINTRYKPIFFYVDSIFALHGLLVCALFALTWMLGGSWLAGLLTVAFYVANKEHTTRVAYVIPLRESFSLPFFWLQLLAVTAHLKSTHSSRVNLILERAAMLVTTFFFAITWQFNQYILLLQAASVCALYSVGQLSSDKVWWIYISHMVALVIVCVMQFINTMILSGILFSFLLAAFVVLRLKVYLPKCKGIISGLFCGITNLGLVALLTVAFLKTAKVLSPQEADEHIGKFLLTKFGFAVSKDFDVLLYVCNDAFRFLPVSTIEQLTENFLFPLYAAVHSVYLVYTVTATLHGWWVQSKFESTSDTTQTKGQTQTSDNKKNSADETSRKSTYRPDVLFHSVNCCACAVIAVVALRMKYLWTPYMAVLASAGLADASLWSWLTAKCSNWLSSTQMQLTRWFIVSCICAAVIHKALPAINQELDNLREFYDPDTVELMQWIKKNTTKDAAFAGSMQLMAGVKLCTGRPITNHPHYEDKDLRLKTRELYEMYAKKSAQHVHAVLKKHRASYIILEDSICLQSFPDGCGLTNILDSEDITEQKLPRFCNEIRYGREPYTQFFKLVFKNHTFRVYAVL